MEDQDQEPARRHQSISMTKCSVLMKGLLLNGLDNADVASGCDECIDIMDNGDYAYNKRGRIVLLLRSFQHAAAAASLFRWWPRGDAIRRVKERMEKMGEDTDRDFAYIHTAIYVGKVRGRHYVIENAGSGERKREGAWLRLTDIKTAFEDLEDDHSKFFILKPPKSGDTAQRAMAAYFKEFTYKYGLYGFNCESFTSACAEVEPDRANPCQRVLAEREDPDVVDEERRAASMRDQKTYSQRLCSVLGEVQADIDKGNFKLVWDSGRRRATVILSGSGIST